MMTHQMGSLLPLLDQAQTPPLPLLGPLPQMALRLAQTPLPPLHQENLNLLILLYLPLNCLKRDE
jgi:hypothetical protein